jgi:hypothetical protein
MLQSKGFGKTAKIISVSYRLDQELSDFESPNEMMSVRCCKSGLSIREVKCTSEQSSSHDNFGSS